MLDVLRRLGDRMLERVVPKAVASACVGAQADWRETCYCDREGYLAPCHWIMRWCTTCGGITSCGPCDSLSTRCC
jgi:hypothetical protein